MIDNMQQQMQGNFIPFNQDQDGGGAAATTPGAREAMMSNLMGGLPTPPITNPTGELSAL
jgi:hypothetical protein